MRFHIPSLPHTQTTKEYCWCAYTEKVRKFCNMMSSLGHEVYLYGGYENEAKVTEFVTVVPEEDSEKWFGGYNWDTTVFDQWDSNAECWQVMNDRVAKAIAERKQPGDILGNIAGLCQKQISDLHPDMRLVEWGIGYEGILDSSFHVFESYAWMHHVYGQRWYKDGRFFDSVVPNSFEDEDYVFSKKKDDYLLYLGRLTPRKGMDVISNLVKQGHRIVMAGQGDYRIPGTEYVGVVRGEEKAKLLANARALLCPTLYIEPFGGVAVEAMLSGTPVIASDFGAFTETVIPGVTGIRCFTLGDFNRAAKLAQELKPAEIRKCAERYLTKNVANEYETYFQRLSLLNDLGWYSV